MPQEPTTACPKSQRADGEHGWAFDGDDPYVVCAWCHERRDALSGQKIEPRAVSQPQEDAVEALFLRDVAAELAKARAKHAPMSSLHEAYAVILEELDEFWDEVRAWRGSKGDTDQANARKELVQIAAMAMRAAEDLL